MDPTWFEDRRVGDDRLRSFASEQLTISPIVLAFLGDVVGRRVYPLSCGVLLQVSGHLGGRGL